METIKDILSICNAAVFYEYKNNCNMDDLNQLGKCIINNLHELVPPSRVKLSLSVSVDMILKISDNDYAKIMDKLNELKEKILYMIGFHRVVREDVDKVRE